MCFIFVEQINVTFMRLLYEAVILCDCIINVYILRNIPSQTFDKPSLDQDKASGLDQDKACYTPKTTNHMILTHWRCPFYVALFGTRCF